MLNGSPVPLADITGALADGTGGVSSLGTTGPETKWTTLPVLLGESGKGAFIRGVGSGSERTRAGKQALLRMLRAAVDGAAVAGAMSVCGVNLPDALSGKPLGNAFATAQSETVKVFKLAAAIALGGTSTVDASNLSTDAIDSDGKGYNWIVIVNGQILRYSATPVNGEIASWTIAAGVVTLRVAAGAAAALPAGSDVVVYKVAASEILASGDHRVEATRFTATDIVWLRVGTNQGANARTLATVEHIAE